MRDFVDIMSNTEIKNVNLKTSSVDIKTEEKMYTKLPNAFVDLESWPKTCNLLCWQCSLPFKGMPIFIPKSIEPLNGNEKKGHFMSVNGVFCSFYHAYEFIKTRSFSFNDKRELTKRVNFLYEKINGKKYIDPITEKPSVYDMKQYGGYLDAEEYSKIINDL